MLILQKTKKNTVPLLTEPFGLPGQALAVLSVLRERGDISSSAIKNLTLEIWRRRPTNRRDRHQEPEGSWWAGWHRSFYLGERAETARSAAGVKRQRPSTLRAPQSLSEESSVFEQIVYSKVRWVNLRWLLSSWCSPGDVPGLGWSTGAGIQCHLSLASPVLPAQCGQPSESHLKSKG